MIRLSKGSAPIALAKNAAAWTAELESALRSGGKPAPSLLRRYAHPDVKYAIAVETAGKCAYCESKVLAITYGHIEHMKPKARYPESTFDWHNLTLACDICNNNKSDDFDEDLPPLNPYQDEPEEHLRPFGGLVFSRTPRGRVTVELVRLNRADLQEQRTLSVRRLGNLVDLFLEAKNPVIKAALGVQLADELSDSVEYSMTRRWFVRTMGIDPDALTED